MPLASRRLRRETTCTILDQQQSPRSCVNPGTEGTTLTAFTEHDSVPWNAIPNQMTLDDTKGKEK